ncbi:hypothetical protein [Nocardia brasiliensis]|uniref:Uncharacterized protein n=1 Tax=Nocardia brasiliensis (strain ATCC 700358 / HUJEG-1) TaxID=1133849 RepID=K0EXG3_NOCB7|nr:hypothetical protein [Nocardia brasiliensis]AFU02172.1 hypothetical protein O3I_021065 [Nocardia brasiliensis ATCC 700358]OCF87628.1 hypothetical protein AW168_24345 [Nocardia brasiliensis]
MTIFENSRSMTSSVCGEWAERVTGRAEPAWLVSWLPHRLNREQARAAMELGELLSRPDFASDHPAQARAEASAGVLGVTVRQALELLHRRMRDRHS